MRIAISNIAWDLPEDETIATLLNHFEIDAIDVAPGKYFPDPGKATDEAIAFVRQWWATRGIEITGMQALLFGTSGLNVFGLPDVQEKMLHHLASVCRIGGGLGATRLVFGSPKNRDRSGLSDEETIKIAVQFFRRLGDIAHSYGVLICLEPNPTSYGANFMTTSAETAHVVQKVAHPAVMMQLDTGAITTNVEELERILDQYGTMIGHVHASEPGLLPLGDGGTPHDHMGKVLRDHLPNHIVSIEMAATKGESHIRSIRRALEVGCQYYRGSRGAPSK